MPMAAAAIAAAWTTVAAAATTFVSALTFASGVMAGISAWSTVASVAALGAALMMKPPGLGSQGQQVNIQMAGPNAAVPLIFGRTGTQGIITYRGTYGTNNDILIAEHVLSVGPVAEIESFSVTGRALTYSGNPNTGMATVTQVAGVDMRKSKLYRYDGLKFAHRVGSLTDTSTLSSITGDSVPWINSTHTMPGLARTILRCKLDEKRLNFPEGYPDDPISVVKGVKCYDPRLDSTYPGGSGSHRWDDQSTHEWSENPFIVGLNFIRGWWGPNSTKLFGLGAPRDLVDVASFVSAANVADANDWTVGGQVLSTDGDWTILTNILASGGGVPTDRGGRISCFVRSPKVSTFTLNSADVLNSRKVTTTTPMADRVNVIVPSCRQANQKWELIAGEAVTDASWLTQDGGNVRTEEIAFPLVANFAQAHQLAAYYAVDSREFLEFEVQAKPRALAVDVGDCIEVDLPEFADGQTWIVMGRKWDPAAKIVSLILKSETFTKHAFALGQSQVAPEPPELVSFDPTNPAGPGASDWTIAANSISTGGTVVPAVVVAGEVLDPNVQKVIVETRLSPVTEADVWPGGVPGDLTVEDIEYEMSEFGWTLGAEGSRVTGQLTVAPVAPATAFDVSVRYERLNGALSERLILGPMTSAQDVAGGVRDGGVDWEANTITNVPPAIQVDENGHLSANYVAHGSNTIASIIDNFDIDLTAVNAEIAQVESDLANAIVASNSVLIGALDGANELIAQATAFRDEAQTAADGAATERDNALSAALQALANAVSSANSATWAQANAVTASTRAGYAGANATAAQTSAGVASTQAGYASANASLALASANLSATYSGQAQANATISQTQAGYATANASTASTQAGLSATYAGQAQANAIAANTSRGYAVSNATISQTQAGYATANASTAFTQAGLSATYSGYALSNATAADTSRGYAVSNATISQTQAGYATANASLAQSNAVLAATYSGQAGANASSAAAQAVIATTQAGYATANATAASTSSSLSAIYRDQAAANATAASGSAATATSQAVIATTQAGYATANASLASTSSTLSASHASSAAGSYANAVIAGGNFHFVDGLTGWTAPGGTYADTHNGRSNVITFLASGNRVARNLRRIPVDPTRRYRVTAELYAGAGTGNALSYTGVKCFDATGTYIGERYPAASGIALTPNAGWLTQTGTITGTSAGSQNNFPVGTTSVELFCYTNDNAAAMATALNYVTIDDVTETFNAQSNATIASTQAGYASANAALASASSTLSATYAGQAESARNTAVRISRNPQFEQGGLFWLNNGWSTANWTYETTGYGASRTHVLRSAAGGQANLISDFIPIAPGSPRYRLKLGMRIIDGSISARFYAGLFFFDAANNLIAASDGTGNYPLGVYESVGGYTWIDREVIVGVGLTGHSSYGGSVAIPAGTVSMRLALYTNYDGTSGVISEVDYFSIEEVTSEIAASANATIATTQATYATSNASVATTQAGLSTTFAGYSSANATLANTRAGYAQSNATIATTQAGYSSANASVATTQAGLSTTFAGYAAANATAANTRAGYAQSNATIATTQAGYSSANAALASTSATLSASYRDAAIVASRNFGFEHGLTGWTYSGATVTYAASHDGRPHVVTLASGAASNIFSTIKIPVDLSTRKYRVRGRYYTGSGSGSSQVYIGFRAYDAAGNALTHNPGSYAYVAAMGVMQAAGAGWVEYVSGVIVPEVAGSVFGYPVGTAQIEVLALMNYNSAAIPTALDEIVFEDITESFHAQANAVIATTQAAYATANASLASTSQSVAATYSGYAQSNATAASTSAATATASAAAASSSASIAASVGHRAINPNAGFDEYPTGASYPINWPLYDGNSSAARKVDPAGGYAVTVSGVAGETTGIYQGLVAGTSANDTYYVIEAEVVPAAPVMIGAGVHVAFYDDAATSYGGAAQIHFGTDPTSSGEIVGAGVAGRRYSFSKLFKSSATNATRLYVYAFNQYSGFASNAASKSIDWYRCVVRPATAQEVAAGVALPALSANVTTMQTTVTNLDTNYALARWEVAAAASGGLPTRIRLTSSTYGSAIALEASEIHFGDNTVFDDSVDVLVTTTGSVARIIAWGAAFGTDGTLTEWEGPSSVTWGNHSRANAYFYRANVSPYFGGSAVPNGQTIGLKAFSGSSGGSSVTATVNNVTASSYIEFSASIDGGSLDADAPQYGTMTFEESSNGTTWATIGTASVTIGSSGLDLGGGVYQSDGGEGSASKVGTKSGNVQYRVTYARTSGSNYVGGATINATVRVTPPIS